MQVVVVEAQRPDSTWVQVGSLGEAEPPGSISSDDPAGRRIIVFGWQENDPDPGVWESQLGFDIENHVARSIVSADLKRLTNLAEPLYLDTIRNGKTWSLRFTLSEENV